MNAINARQSGTASALMGALDVLCSAVLLRRWLDSAAKTMLKMSFAMSLCYLAALLIGLKSRGPRYNLLRR